MKRNNLPKTEKEFRYSMPLFISTLLTSFFIVSAIRLLTHINDKIYYTSLEFLQINTGTLDFLMHLFFIVAVGGILTLLEYLFPNRKITPYTMLVSAFIFSLLLMYNDTSSMLYTCFAVIFMMALVILYATKEGCFSGIRSEFHPAFLWGFGVGFAIVCCFIIAGIGVYRYLSYSTPNFDFGIFCNMFYNMKKSGAPIVTCERDMVLSHFAVHFSPVYYLMLPFYFVFPSPVTLQILQAVVLYSGIVPLILIARKKGISSKVTLVLSAIYAAYPALGAGTFYDLHENCFLVPMLLWVFYFYESKKYIPMAVFCILTLTVKEDAFMYLMFFAVFLLISEKKWKLALPVAAVSLIYFISVSSLMQAYGDGIMTNRYDNLIYGDGGLLGAVKTLIVNPGYALTQIFVTSDGGVGKLKYLLLLLLPLGFMPFATKKISRYLLLCPILINILTMYKYQPDISFQYSFGIIAFLFYITILNVSEMQGFSKKYLISVAAVASVLIFVVTAIPRYNTYSSRYNDYSDTYERFDHALTEVLPKDCSVAASSFLIPHIYERDEIYEVRYHRSDDGKYKTDIEYVVLDMRYTDESTQAAEFYLANGYEEFYLDKDYIMILKKK